MFLELRQTAAHSESRPYMSRSPGLIPTIGHCRELGHISEPPTIFGLMVAASEYAPNRTCGNRTALASPRLADVLFWAPPIPLPVTCPEMSKDSATSSRVRGEGGRCR